MFIISVMVIPVTDYRDLLDAMSSLGDDVWCVNVVVAVVMRHAVSPNITIRQLKNYHYMYSKLT